MLHAKQSCKRKATKEETTFLGEDDRENEDAIHGSIVLEVDVIDDQETGRQEYCQRCCMCCCL